jgi:hypothetical protein
MTPDLKLEGRPRAVYDAALLLLDDVTQRRISARELLIAVLRTLLLVRDEQ